MLMALSKPSILSGSNWFISHNLKTWHLKIPIVFPKFDFQIFFMIKIRNMKQQKQNNNDSLSISQRQMWNCFLDFCRIKSVLEYESIHLHTIQDMKNFSLQLSTFQNPEQTKKCWAKLIFHQSSANLLFSFFLQKGFSLVKSIFNNPFKG